MEKNLTINRSYLAIGVTIGLLLTLFSISKSIFFSQHAARLSVGITADLLLIVPLVYFLLIRKTSVPNTTVVPVIVVGMLLGFYILPEENQYYLNAFKTLALPFIELAVVGFVIYKVRKTVKAFHAQKINSPDFFTALKEVCYEIMPRAAAIPFATEIAVFYYGFINWKKRTIKTNEFTHHKESGALPLLAVFIFIILVETFVIHLLLERWSSLAAWIVTGLSCYTALQVWGVLRSIPKRPFIVEAGQLKLRYGILNETTIDLENIESIEAFTESVEKEDGIAHLSPLMDMESHNLLVTLKEEGTLHGLYGMKKHFKKLAFFADNKNDLLNMIESKQKE